MNLESAIKHCEEVAYEQDMKAGFETDYQTYTMYEEERKRYRECANNYRQLAEWLRELKAYRDDRGDCDYETLKIKLENAEDVIRGLQEDLRDAREELRWR